MLSPASSASDVADDMRKEASASSALLINTPELSSALATATNLNSEQSLLLYQYFVAVAMGEKAEAMLAGQPILPEG